MDEFRSSCYRTITALCDPWLLRFASMHRKTVFGTVESFRNMKLSTSTASAAISKILLASAWQQIYYVSPSELLVWLNPFACAYRTKAFISKENFHMERKQTERKRDRENSWGENLSQGFTRSPAAFGALLHSVFETVGCRSCGVDPVCVRACPYWHSASGP